MPAALTTPGALSAAGIVAVVLLAIVALFQMALALGAPWGRAAWGGRHDGILPPRFRLASGFAAVVVYPLIVLVILDASATVDISWLTPGPGVVWGLVALFTIGTLANLASPSKVERVWAPVSLGIVICCAIVATGIG